MTWKKNMFVLVLVISCLFLCEKSIQTRKQGGYTYEKLLTTAIKPVGTTMYVWGGGWNGVDAGAGTEAVTIGVSKRWAEFAASCDAAYDFEQTRYQRQDGLDCSGYIGWLIYNVFQKESGKKGYVMPSTIMAKTFAEYGWGTFTPASQVTEWKAGDIMSMTGHVWMSLGMCEDQSVVLVHASPPGVRIAGTLREDGTQSEAVTLAEKYMGYFYPDWYRCFPDCGVSNAYLTQSAQFRWHGKVLKDTKGYLHMSANEVLYSLYFAT